MIIQDEEILRTPCVDATSEEVGPLIDQLERELKHSAEKGLPGIGLAAIQIGVFKNVAIIRAEGLNVDLVNCKLEKGYDKVIFENEGCLSFPGRYERTWRYQEIYVVDNLVEPYSFIGTGLFAVATLHEMDHMSNILLPDLAIKNNENITKKKIRPNDKCICGSGKKFKKCCNKL